MHGEPLRWLLMWGERYARVLCALRIGDERGGLSAIGRLLDEKHVAREKRGWGRWGSVLILAR